LEAIRGRPDRFLNILNVTSHFRPKRIEKGLHFGRGAFDDQMHSAVGQIPHKTRHPMVVGQTSGRISKPDALHRAGIVDFAQLFALARHAWSSLQTFKYSAKLKNLPVAGYLAFIGIFVKKMG
jgi:hypothetical protein